MTPDREAEAARAKLHAAADELFDLRDVCDEFHDLNETRKGQAVLKQLSMKAGGRAQAFTAWCLNSQIRPTEPDMSERFERAESANIWLDAPIADCLAEAENFRDA